MSLKRQIERNQLKKRYKEHTKGVEKKYRTSFSNYWKAYNEYKKKREG